MEKSFAERDIWAAWIDVDPRFAELRKDPRYRQFAERIKPLKEEDAIHQSQIETKILSVKNTEETGKVEDIKEIGVLPTVSKKRYKILAVSVLVMLSVVYFGYRYGIITVEFGEKKSADTPVAATPTTQKAIAILPFKADQNSENENFLGIGLAESLYRKLGQVKELSVRPAMLNLSREQSAKELGESFGVAYILRGTLHETAETIQINAELIDTFNETVIWAEQFNEPIKDFPSLQVAISERVLRALTVQLTAAESQRIKKNYTQNSEAYQLYLIGRYQMANRSVENLRRAIDTFSRARDLDADFALAYAGLADAYSLLNLYQIDPPKNAYSMARENAQKALSIDEGLAEAHASLAYVLFYNDRNRAGAEKHFLRAIELNPSYSTAHHWFALALAAMGKRDESIRQINAAAELEPQSAIIHSAAGLVYFYAEHYEEGLNACNQSLNIDLGMVPAYKTKRIISETTGNYEEALSAYRNERAFRGNTDEDEPGWAMITAQVFAVGGKRKEALNELEKVFKSKRVLNNLRAFAYEIAVAYALLGEQGKALEWLEKAEINKDHSFNFAMVDPRLAILRSSSHYAEIVSVLQVKNP